MTAEHFNEWLAGICSYGCPDQGDGLMVCHECGYAKHVFAELDRLRGNWEKLEEQIRLRATDNAQRRRDWDNAYRKTGTEGPTLRHFEVEDRHWLATMRGIKADCESGEKREGS